MSQPSTAAAKERKARLKRRSDQKLHLDVLILDRSDRLHDSEFWQNLASNTGPEWFQTLGMGPEETAAVDTLARWLNRASWESNV